MAKAAGVSDDRGVGIDERHAGRVDDGALDGAAATQVPRTTRVACIDDDTLIREGITRLLHDVTVVGPSDRLRHSWPNVRMPTSSFSTSGCLDLTKTESATRV